MKPLPLSALLVIAALAYAAPAAAKELTKITTCGQGDRCASITEADQLRQVPMGGATAVPAPPQQPFYTLQLTIDHGDESDYLLIYYLPRAELLAANGAEPGTMVWLPITDPQGREILRRATKDLDAFPAPNVWPRELKSHYRVIPDDQLPAAASPTSAAAGPERNAAESADEHTGASVVWLYATVSAGLAVLASLLYARRKHGRVPPKLRRV